MTSVRPVTLQGLRWGEAVPFSSMYARGQLSEPFLRDLDRFGEGKPPGRVASASATTYGRSPAMVKID